MRILVAGVVLAAAVGWAHGRVSSRDEELGVPTFYWASPDEARDWRSLGLTPVEAARRYLLEHATLYGAAPARLAGARVSAVHDLHDGSAVIVTFEQRVGDVRVFRDELKVIMTARLELVALSGYLTPRTRALAAWALSPQSAVTSAWLRLTGAPLEAGLVRHDHEAEGDFTHWQVDGAQALRTRQVWYPGPTGLTPGFYVELELNDGRFFSFVVSAADGAVLYQHDLTVSHAYRVWADPVTLVPWPGPQGPDVTPHPQGMPTGLTQPSPLAPSLVTLDHAGLSTGDPWLVAGATETRGNNVLAYVDLEWPNGFGGIDETATVTAPGAFLWSYDFAALPWAAPSERAASLVHLFYVTNFLHDWFYDDGFNEAARNGQTLNFGRGGAGNDPLLAEGMDWSGLDNANMSTPADGLRPRMQMYLFRGAQWRDASLDTGVVAHEWGHFISNRLVGDGNGLSSLQAGGLGEGWGDFHAALLLATADDALVPANARWQGTWSLAAWSAGTWFDDGVYFGFRRYALSASLARNPLTFRHIADGEPLPTGAPRVPGYVGPNAEVHNTGEVWAAMLWDCYVALLTDSRFTFEQARARMKRTLVASYKATPLTPTFVEARDAVLAVAAANDPADLQLFWAAFARRGLGRAAQAPLRNGQHNSPLVEDFTVGGVSQLGAITLRDDAVTCDGDGTLDVGEEGRLLVEVRNVGPFPLTGATLTVSSDLPAVLFPGGVQHPLPDLASFDRHVVEVPISLASSLRGAQSTNLTVAVTGATFSPSSVVAAFRLNVDARVASSAHDDVEPAQSVWSASSDPALGPSLTFRREQLTAAQHVWFAPSPSSTADLWLVSPPLHVGERGLKLTFRHRWDFDRTSTQTFDGAVLEASTDDGLTWTDVGSALSPPYPGVVADVMGGTNPLRGRPGLVGQSPNYPSFIDAVLDLPGLARQTVRLRFRVGADDAVSWPAHGWELDELDFDGLTDTPFASLTGDPNTCTNRAPVALAGGPLEVDEATRVVLQGTLSDPDGDAVTGTWTQTAGPAGTLIGNAFTTPEVTVDTPLTLTLVADDGRTTSPPSELLLTVRNVNHPPTVSTSAALEARAGELVSVHGTARDADGDSLVLGWQQVEGPPVELTGASTADVSFVAPAVTELTRLTLQLVARDLVSEASARVVVTVRPLEATPQEPPPTPKGCGCTTAEGLGGLALLAAVARRRRREQAPPHA